MQRSNRLKRELESLLTDTLPGISCWTVDDNIGSLEAQILGPDETPYSGGAFKLKIEIPDRYPFVPPKVNFQTKIYHPNIDTEGRICLDILKPPPKGAWSPAQNIRTVLMSIRLLIAEPNPEDPLIAEIADEFKNRPDVFVEKATKYTKDHAGSANKQTENELNGGANVKNDQAGGNNKVVREVSTLPEGEDSVLHERQNRLPESEAYAGKKRACDSETRKEKAVKLDL